MRRFPKHLTLLLCGAVILGACGGWLAAQAAGQETSSPTERREQYLDAGQLMQDVFDRIMLNYVDELDPRKIAEAAVRGMLDQLDEHSDFLPPRTYDDLMMSTEGEFGGLGITINVRDHYPTVISPLEGTPAYYMGVQGGDQITEIDGVSTYDLTSNDAVGKLRGPKGTQVNITIKRPGREAPIPLTITRDTIKVESVPYAFMMDDIGYVRVSNFARTTADELKVKLDELTAKNPKGLVVDLRWNPGGLLGAAKQVSELFLPRGDLLVYTKGRLPSNSMSFESEAVGKVYDGVPIIVLVNGSSASASEIVAAALQDHDAALVVGNTTFGKGSVQTVFPLNEDEALKLTTARYFTPSGRSIHKDRPEEGHHLFGPETPEGEDAAAPPAADLEPAAAEREIPRHERERFHTDSGRVVYGGGGITPDIEIEQEFLSDFEVAVERDYALFSFAVDYANQHGEIASDFRVSEAVFKEFKTYLRGREKLPEYLGVFKLSLSDSLMDANADFLKWGVRRELVRRTGGAQAAYQVAIEKDSQLHEVIQLFGKGPGLPALFTYADAWNREHLAKAAADSAAAASKATAEVGP
jgi:carboxyl-terminal processing protease